MKRCTMCFRDREDAPLIQVVPGTWSGFNNFVRVCPACQQSDAYRKLVKQKKIVAPPAEAATVNTAE